MMSLDIATQLEMAETLIILGSNSLRARLHVPEASTLRGLVLHMRQDEFRRPAVLFSVQVERRSAACTRSKFSKVEGSGRCNAKGFGPRTVEVSDIISSLSGQLYPIS
jgi:hypothetical protein